MAKDYKKATKEFCAELRKFSIGLEKSCRDLRDAAEARHASEIRSTFAPLQDSDSPYQVDDMYQQVVELEKEIEDLEVGTVGSVSIHELLGHFTELYRDIEEGTALLETELVKYGYTAPENMETQEDIHEPVWELPSLQSNHRGEPPATSATSRMTSGNIQDPTTQAWSVALPASIVTPQAATAVEIPAYPAAEHGECEQTAPETKYVYEDRVDNKPPPPPSTTASNSENSTKASNSDWLSVDDMGLSAATLAALAGALSPPNAAKDSTSFKYEAPAVQSYTFGSRSDAYGGASSHTREMEIGQGWTSVNSFNVETPAVITRYAVATPGAELPAGRARFDTTPASSAVPLLPRLTASGQYDLVKSPWASAVASDTPAVSSRYVPTAAVPSTATFSGAPAVEARFSGTAASAASASGSRLDVPDVSHRYTVGNSSALSASEPPSVISAEGAGDARFPVAKPLTVQEFDSLHHSFRKGITFEDANNAIALINNFVKSMSQQSHGQLGSDTFNSEDMVRLGFGAKVRGYLMLLTKLERIQTVMHSGSIMYRILPTPPR